MYYQRAVTIGVPCNTFQMPACKTFETRDPYISRNERPS